MSVIVICLICGGIAALIARRQNNPIGQAFVIGALLNIIGIIIVAVAPSGLPKAPSGMRSVKCPRCNAVQNIYDSQPEYECWQCQKTTNLWEH